MQFRKCLIIIIIIRTFVTRAVSANILNLRRSQCWSVVGHTLITVLYRFLTLSSAHQFTQLKVVFYVVEICFAVSSCCLQKVEIGFMQNLETAVSRLILPNCRIILHRVVVLLADIFDNSIYILCIQFFYWCMYAFVVLGFVFSIRSQQIGFQNVSEMTYFVSSEM